MDETYNIPDIRQCTDVTFKVRLTLGGVFVDWSDVSHVSAYLYSSEQRVMAGKCTVVIDPNDSTRLICTYGADRQQFLGNQKVVILCDFGEQRSVYDKVAFRFVGSTAETVDEEEEQAEEESVIDIEIDGSDIDTSVIYGAVNAALAAAEEAMAAASAAQIAGYEDTTDPTDAEYQDEYQRILEVLYQAIEDALQVTRNTTEAKIETQRATNSADAAAVRAEAARAAALEAQAEADRAAREAEAAKEEALDAAIIAGQKSREAEDAAGDAGSNAAAALAAAQLAAEKAALAAEKAALAAEKAAYATGQGDYAKAQGDYAKEQIDDARGNFMSIDERLQHYDEISVTLDETTDPTDAEYQDEYQRILEVLYQAIEDARGLSEDVKAATQSALNAASAANSAAGVAMHEAAAAAILAHNAANDASAAAEQALDAAHAAQDAMNDAKGSYTSLNSRLEHIETAKQDVIADISTIRTNAEAGATAVQSGDIARVAMTGAYSDLEGAPSKLSDLINDVAIMIEDESDPSTLVNDN